MKKLWIVVLMLLLPWVAWATTYQIKPGVSVVLPQLAAPWVASTEPNPELVAHLTEHVVEDAALKGKTLTPEQARQIALKRASNNQLFVSNPQSGAHLLISFVRLDEKEAPPTAVDIENSAKYSVESAAEEGWAITANRQAVTAISGAQLAQWFTIDYSHENEQQRFSGIVGFAHPYWFWFYANDHLKNPADQKTLEQLLLNSQIQIDHP